MLRHFYKILVFLIFAPVFCYGQETDQGPSFQMLMIKNPSLSGVSGDGVLRLSYLNFYPGNSYNLHSVYLSYDSYFTGLHGGAGVYLSDDYLGGIVNDLKAGLFYSYYLQAGKDFFVNAGLSASVYHRGYNFTNAVLPDQIDPLGGVSLPTSETLTSLGKTVIDIDAGFLFIYKMFNGGFSVRHLAEPDLSVSRSSVDRLRRKLLVHASGDFAVSKSQSLRIQPIMYIEIQSGFINGGAGTALSLNSLAINALILGDNAKNLNLQTGFSFTAGRILIYYNYRFNAVSGNKLMPLSLLHQTGLAFSLNNVEKRNTIKTINFPKL